MTLKLPVWYRYESQYRTYEQPHSVLIRKPFRSNILTYNNFLFTYLKFWALGKCGDWLCEGGLLYGEWLSEVMWDRDIFRLISVFPMVTVREPPVDISCNSLWFVDWAAKDKPIGETCEGYIAPLVSIREPPPGGRPMEWWEREREEAKKSFNVYPKDKPN